MKKLFLFVAAVALTVSLNSCSKSSSSSSSDKISFKINGVSKSFSNVITAESGGMIVVNAYNGTTTNPTETLTMRFTSGATGAAALTNFSYGDDTNDYDNGTSGFVSNTTANSSTSLKGTFSGTVEPFQGSTNATITGGTFSISR